jgi:lysophospholipase L1-like esterase
MNRATAALAITLAGIVAGAGIPSPAQAAATSYAALGDSYSSGVGAGPYDDSGCRRSERSYPALWAAAHDVDAFQFVACGGAATADVLTDQVPALDATTSLVTVTVGGNDAGFGDVLTTCQLGSDAECAAVVEQSRTFISTELPARLDGTYAAIRAQAPDARLVVLGYPRLFEVSDSCGLLGMSSYKRTILNEGADLLNEVTAGRAAAASADFVDVRETFDGHGVCADSPWITDVTALTAAFHPNAEGHSSGYLTDLTAVTG